MAYTFQRGETVLLGLALKSGSINDVTPGGVAAAMKLVMGGRYGADVSLDPIDFTVTERAAAGDIPAGWNLMIGADASALLAIGTYQANAQFMVGSGLIKSDPVMVRIVDSAI